MMTPHELNRAIERAQLIVKVNVGKEAIAEEVNMARVLLELLAALDEEYGR